ncbi:MAG TPA: histidine phosphatase family protein [Bryobacteraceae bacterium]|nr:histidine phosphatase family protein [Bryobacteraceae bacterium]
MSNGKSIPHEIWMVRHGETEWSRSGQHTSRTDLPLTLAGEDRARRLGSLLQTRRFALVLSSPMRRALDTCRLAGFSPQVSQDLREWDYGDYEGLTTAQIRQIAPGWAIWTAPPKGGETLHEVSARADRVLARALQAGGDVALFGHGHMLRVFAARWIGFAPDCGRSLALATGSVSVLGWEHDWRVIRLWSQVA